MIKKLLVIICIVIIVDVGIGVAALGAETEGTVQELDQTDIEELCRIVHAEARGECFIGKVAVANVVLNRVMDQRFPDNVYDVIHAQGQFAPANKTEFSNIEWSDETERAAYNALAGQNVVDDALFFNNPSTSKDAEWFATLEAVETIQNHRFYK